MYSVFFVLLSLFLLTFMFIFLINKIKKFSFDYWGAKKGVLPPHPNYWGARARSAPQSTPMRPSTVDIITAPGGASDHRLVAWPFHAAQVEMPVYRAQRRRSWRQFDVDQFRADL